MNSLSIDMKDYRMISDGTFYEEFKKICQTSPVLVNAKLFIFKYRVRRIVGRILKINRKLIRDIKKYDFNTLERFMESSGKILESLNRQAEQCYECPSGRCKNLMINELFMPVTDSFKRVILVIHENCRFKADDYFSAEEYDSNSKTLNNFEDLWNFESSAREDGIAFKYNALTSFNS